MEEDPLALPFIKCETQGDLPHSGETEEKIFVPELSYNCDNVDADIKTENFNDSQFVEYTGIEAVDYSTDTASEVSNVQEEFTDLLQKPIIIDEKIPYSGHSETYNEEICQNNITPKWKPTPSQSTHFICNICSKIIKGKFALKTHINTHSGERPFSCNICNKTFSRKRILQEHELLHTGERPYACEVCQKSFAKKGTLIKHKVVHTGDRKHSCDICNKKFAQRSGLMKHRVTHTGERPYSCNFCDKAFTMKCGLKRHTDKFHSDECNLQNESTISQ